MFNEEEKKLRKWKSEIEKIDAPEVRLKEAIENGFNRAKKVLPLKQRTRYKRGIWSAVIAAILLLTLVTSIRVSPAFASAISSIPGMEKIVELIRYDKGIVSAIENDYFQPLQLSSEKDGVTFTVEGVIMDDDQMVVFYTLKGDYEDIGWEEFKLFDQNGRELPVGVSSYWVYGNEQKSSEKSSNITIYFYNKEQGNDFILKGTLGSELKPIEFEIPFTVEEIVKPIEVFTVNETFIIEGQEITIRKVEISPLRVGVHFQTTPSNTKEVFSFSDLRLVNENQEAWTTIVNGEGSRGTKDEERVVYLQSNYFEKPKELFLKFNKIQTLNKDEAYVLVDLDKKIILEQPSDKRFKEVTIENDSIIILFNSGSTDHMFPFASEVEMVESKRESTCEKYWCE